MPVAPEARAVEASPATTADPAVDGGTADSGAPPARVDTSFVYNRVLAKLADPNLDLTELEEQVEARTGASVKEIKKGPMGLLAIVFDDVKPPRGEAEQRALVEQLKGMPALRYAEPERLLQAR